MERPGEQRDLVFCHQCENEWYRDEHGLICPTCHSEFTEIIESDHDPRVEQQMIIDDDDDEGDEQPAHMRHFPPWGEPPDPEDGNIDHFEWRSNGPGNFTISGTVYRNVNGPPAGMPPGLPPAHVGQHPIFQDFSTMLRNITGNNLRPPAQTPDGPNNNNHNDNSNHHRSSSMPGRPEALRHGGQTENGPGGGPRFTYSSTARLFPRDANHPQPRFEPVDDLQTILGQLFSIQQRMPHGPHGPHGPPGPPGPPGQPGQGEGHPPNPLAALFSAFLNPAAAAHGDAVYTQEALDRVISQLMEQNATGNAPGPANPEAIAALPKKTVEASMLDDNGRGECSICMDEVLIGEKVTYLPCSHWFHGLCIEAWLKEHDTCPHCRQGITPRDGTNRTPNSGPGPTQSGPGTPGPHTYQTPGAWEEGSGSRHHPYVVRDTNSPSVDRGPSRPSRHPSSSGNSASSANAGGSGSYEGGIGGTLRNLFRGARGGDRPS